MTSTTNVAWELLANPLRFKIASSQWLMLYCVSQYGKTGGRLEQIDDRLDHLEKELQKDDKDFFLVWSSGYELKDVLRLFCDMGFLEEKIDQESNEPVWSITKRGEKLLQEKSKFAPPGISY